MKGGSKRKEERWMRKGEAEGRSKPGEQADKPYVHSQNYALILTCLVKFIVSPRSAPPRN